MEKKIKRDLTGRFVKLLFQKKDNRNMKLEEFKTRCVREKDLHEIVTTDQESTEKGNIIKRVGFIGFAEFETGGVVQQDDLVYINNRLIGKVKGFDKCHYPNHYNILIKTKELISAEDIDIGVEDIIMFVDSRKKDD